MSFLPSIVSLISTACSWCGIIPWANMASAALWPVEAGALLDIIPEPWSIPGMELPAEALLEAADGPEDPVEHPARASAAATAVAERVRNFLVIIGNQALQGISGRVGARDFVHR
jgi:hypothetical protein